MSHPHIKRRYSFQVSKNSELFIAVCYRENIHHSFTIVGIQDNDANQAYILCGIGKGIDFESYPRRCKWFHFLTEPTKSKLMEENYLFRPRENKIYYKAFSISTEQYNEYLTRINGSERFGIGAYYAAGYDESTGLIDYVYADLYKDQFTPVSNLNESVQTIRVNNTCRHTAKKIVDFTIGEQYADHDGISPFFLTKMPFQTRIANGKTNSPLYIFPLPPCQQSTPNKYKTLCKIYQQMEKISQSYQKNELTLKKFNQLKNLYHHLDHSRSTLPLKDFFSIIENWEQENQKLIDTKRSFSLFKHTATRNMVSEILSMKQKYILK